MTMKNLACTFALAFALGGCGPKQPGSSVNNAGGTEPAVKDTRTELERRRDAACETLAPRMTDCALADAKTDLAAGKVSQKQFDQDTAPAILKKNSEKFIEACTKADYSSRQVRVLEVCQHEETECEPMLSCLDNLTNVK